MTQPNSFASFPSTQWGVLSQAGDADRETRIRRSALETLSQLYWKPVYAYLRLRWKKSVEEAADLTQDFFLMILDGVFLNKADAERGRFRDFLKACLDNFVLKAIRRDRAQMRGGGLRKLSIDFGEDPDRFLVDRKEDTPEEILDRHWRKSVLEEALCRLEESYRDAGRSKYFDVFRLHDLRSKGDEAPTYEKIAADLGIARSDVDNYLRHARKAIVAKIREILSAGVRDPSDLAEEERDFLKESPW